MNSTSSTRQANSWRSHHRSWALWQSRSTLCILCLQRGPVASISPVRLMPPISGIEAAVDGYGVQLLQGPKLTPEEQIAFAGLFGPLEPQNGVLTTGIAPRVTRKLVDISNLDENNALLSQADRRRMFALGNQLWHT